MADNGTVTHFVVLFTAQKQKKFKTWQDGTMKYYSFNRKLVLIDEKGYSIDRTFYKGGVPSVGDEVEFEGHIVTIESLESTEITNNNAQLPLQFQQPTPQTTSPTATASTSPQSRATGFTKFKPPTMIPRKRIIKAEPEDEEDDIIPTATNNPIDNQPKEPSPIPKRVRVGLSKRTSSPLHQSLQTTNPISFTSTTPMPPTSKNTTSTPCTAKSTTPMPPATKSTTPLSKAVPIETLPPSVPVTSSFTKASDVPPEDTSMTGVKPFKSPFADGNYTPFTLQFPNSKKALGYVKSKKYPKRSKVIPTKFSNPNAYKDALKKVIYEHLEILLLNYSMYFYSMYEKFGKSKTGAELERVIRSKGMGLYCEVDFRQDHRHGRLKLKQKEHHSKYNKDDIWVISLSPMFESSQTFLARSTFYGPFSDGTLELDCISPRDARIANQCCNKKVYALRTVSASTEFMMLDTVEGGELDRLPLLPYLLGPSKKKQMPLPMMKRIELTREDNMDVEKRVQETVKQYHLNQDQESVLRQVAKSVVSGPGWEHEKEQHEPIVLVHGVYGSGKSFLAAVIIIFLQELMDTVSSKREPDQQIQFKILISSMTNVAVDRILQTLLKLGFDHFVRIGSMRKIAKNLLPYTAKARLSSNEELKELEQMLEDKQNSEEDIEYISTAIQHFRKATNKDQIHCVNVVGTTFMSSTFEIFDHVQFPFVLVDESSQLMEPLTLVPLARFSCHRLVMIGDPLQLPPTLGTNAEEGKLGMGLDKTMFDRLVEMGSESIMLRTQYRCHPRISNISNRLFYDRRLIHGVSDTDRKPLLEGLPTLMFVDVGGSEQKSIRNNSYWNDEEIKLSLDIIKTLLSHDISACDIGVISLYKEQADKLLEQVSSLTKNIQISTVDAFQGGEKEVIILSTVRSNESSFMDNQPRINVALTRAKRHLIILGNHSTFSMNELWSKVLWDCQENCLNSKSLATVLSHLA